MHGWSGLMFLLWAWGRCKDVQAGLCQAWVLGQLRAMLTWWAWSLMQVSGQWAGRRGKDLWAQLPTARRAVSGPAGPGTVPV